VSKPTQLSALQRAMQDSILGTDNAATISVHNAPEGAERLQIYASAYQLRLQEALASNFPMLQSHLGAESFAAVANEYIAAHPSNHVSIRDVGAQLAQWLRDHRANEPWLAEFACFEWALAHAFDAQNAATVSMESLAALQPAQWPTLQFQFAPATQRVTSHTNAPELYRAAANDEGAAQGEVSETSSEWLIWRRELTAQYRSLTRTEADALDTLLAGGTLGDACEAMLEYAEADVMAAEAASFLKRWLLDELISSFSVGPIAP
jgi:hypothetical protein